MVICRLILIATVTVSTGGTATGTRTDSVMKTSCLRISVVANFTTSST